MRRGLTEAEARVLRHLGGMTGATTLMGEDAVTFHRLMGTTLLTVGVSAEGFAALRAYDAGQADPAARDRIARGMASAGRAALSDHGGRSDA